LQHRSKLEAVLPPTLVFSTTWDPFRPWFQTVKEPEGRSDARERIMAAFRARLLDYFNRVEEMRSSGPPGMEEQLAAKRILPEHFRWLVKRVVPFDTDRHTCTAGMISDEENTESGGPREQTIYSSTRSLARFLKLPIPRVKRQRKAR